MVERLHGKKVIGIKQVLKAINKGEGEILYVSLDADVELTRSVVELAVSEGIKVNYINTMKELGRLCGIDVGAAVTLIIKDK